MSQLDLEPNTPIKSQLEETMDSILQELKHLNLTMKYAALGPDRILEFLHQDKLFRMYLPFAETDVIQRTILKNRNFWELRNLKMIQSMISPESVVIDAGANIGNHSVFFGGVCRAKQVYAFEPLRETYRLLKRNLDLNSLTNVQPINAALGAEPSQANLSKYSQANMGASVVEYVTAGDYEVTTIDTLDLQRLDFIKIDVEGRHLPVLQGAQKTIDRCKPLILIELRAKHGELESGDAALKKLGYQQINKISQHDYLYGPLGRSV